MARILCLGTGKSLTVTSKIIASVPSEPLTSLPKLKGDKTYQIWADVDNEMLSIGTFSNSEELIALGYYDDATSLNITVEPKGGSDHPTLSTLTASKAI